MNIFLIIGIAVIVIIVIAVVAMITTSDDSKPSNNINFSNYKKVDSILSDAEFNFFNVLSLALNNSEYIICPKVRIADFVKVLGKESRQSNFNRIRSKHIDFLICNKKLTPVVAIELDDKSHSNKQDRDNFVNELYKSINLPILRIKNGQEYSVIELREKIKEII